MVQQDTFMNTRHIVGFKCHVHLWTLNKKARRSHTISMISARETRIKTWGWPEKPWYQNRTVWPWLPLETVGEYWDESNSIGISQRSDEKSDQVKESILFVFIVSRISIPLDTLKLLYFLDLIVEPIHKSLKSPCWQWSLEFISFYSFCYIGSHCHGPATVLHPCNFKYENLPQSQFQDCKIS